MAKSAAFNDYMQAVESLLPLIETEAEAAERQFHLSDRVVTALRNSGIYAMLLPRALGGGELPFAEAMEIVARLAWADASTGWCTMVNGVMSASLGAFVAEAGARAVFGKGPDVTIAGNGVPRGYARRVPGGYMIRGHWAYGSGIHHAEWIHSGCFLMDGDKGLRFIPAEKMNAHVCDLVEVVGFPDLSGPSPVLREALVRRLGLAELPKPDRLKAYNLLRDDYDSTLVQVEGVLLGVSSQPDGSVLEVQCGLRRFTAVIKDETGLSQPLTPGSRLELTGVYAGQGGNRVLGRPIDSFQLLLNSGFDIRVLARPPWWTLQRLISVVGVLFLVLVAALMWIKSLHHQIAERTLQLETQIRGRQRAERQREMEQERARVAHDLHDDLGAGLTEVNMLTSLVNSPTTTAEEKVRYVDELNEMARRMVTSLDEIVWAVNPRNDTFASLASYFGAYAQRLLELASVACGLDVAENLPDYPLDPKFRQELFLAFKEGLTNIIRHAHATKVWLRISVQNGTLTVTLSDNGRGIELGKRDTGADGLANMQERLSALGGRCEILSEPGSGTTVRFQAPLPKRLQ